MGRSPTVSGVAALRAFHHVPYGHRSGGPPAPLRSWWSLGPPLRLTGQSDGRPYGPRSAPLRGAPLAKASALRLPVHPLPHHWAR